MVDRFLTVTCTKSIELLDAADSHYTKEVLTSQVTKLRGWRVCVLYVMINVIQLLYYSVLLTFFSSSCVCLYVPNVHAVRHTYVCTQYAIWLLVCMNIKYVYYTIIIYIIFNL